MQHPLAPVTMAGLVLCEAALRLRGGEGLDAANHFRRSLEITPKSQITLVLSPRWLRT